MPGTESCPLCTRRGGQPEMEPELLLERSRCSLGGPCPLCRGHPPTKSQALEGQHPALCS